MTNQTSNTYVLFQYAPSIPANVVFAILFAVILAIAVTQLALAVKSFKNSIYPKKFSRFTNVMIPFLVGLVFEIVGFAVRVGCNSDQNSVSMYAIQSLLLLLAPVLFAATIYMLLGEVIKSLNAQELSLVKIKFITKIFVAGDICSFLLQGAGGGIMAGSSQSSVDIGKILILVGLFVQIVFFGAFMVLLVHFTVQIYKNPSKVSQILQTSNSIIGNWKHALYALLFSSIFIMVRSIYRVVEYIQGFDGSLQQREIYLFFLDGFMMLLCCTSLLSVNYVNYLCSTDVQLSSAFDDYELRASV